MHKVKRSKLYPTFFFLFDEIAYQAFKFQLQLLLVLSVRYFSNFINRFHFSCGYIALRICLLFLMT